MSIYDFILNGESQEVVNLLDEMKVMTSESQPQVDEAQEVIKGRVVEKDMQVMINSIMLPVETPSSDLDTYKLIRDNLVFNPDGYAEKVVELDCNPIPTEDTDLTLFSVGDTVKVVNIYDKTHEDYEYMETVKERYRVITSEVYITKGNKKHYNTVSHGESWLPSNEVPFYIEELQKI